MRRVKQNPLDKDYLWPAAVVSVLLHVLLIWAWLPSGEKMRAQTPDLPTAVINYRTLETPDIAERLAQWDAQGGGEDAEGVASSPLHGSGPLSIDNLFLQALQRKQQELETEQRELLHRLQEQAENIASTTPEADTAPKLMPTGQGDDDLTIRSEEHTSELQSRGHLVCRLLLEKNRFRNWWGWIWMICPLPRSTSVGARVAGIGASPSGAMPGKRWISGCECAHSMPRARKSRGM